MWLPRPVLLHLHVSLLHFHPHRFFSTFTLISQVWIFFLAFHICCIICICTLLNWCAVCITFIILSVENICVYDSGAVTFLVIQSDDPVGDYNSIIIQASLPALLKVLFFFFWDHLIWNGEGLVPGVGYLVHQGHQKIPLQTRSDTSRHLHHRKWSHWWLVNGLGTPWDCWWCNDYV